MTTDNTVNSGMATQTDLIRYFDCDLVTAGSIGNIDRFAIEAKARYDRAALVSEMIGGGVAWLWQRATHFGETQSPTPRLYVESRVQF